MEQAKDYNLYLKKLHNEWLSNLDEISEYLRGIDVATFEMQASTREIEILADLILVRNAIVLEKNEVNELRIEIMNHYKRVISRRGKATISALRDDAGIRKKIGKIEQSVYMLKYQVNKLLSLAS